MHAHMKNMRISCVRSLKKSEVLDRELGGLEIGTWTKPLGGYSFPLILWKDVQKLSLRKQSRSGTDRCGCTAYPYGRDPKTILIRIAKSFPTVEELAVAVRNLRTERKISKYPISFLKHKTQEN